MRAPTRILRAAWVLPITGPPIPDGEVVVEEDRIVAIRPAGTSHHADVTDFGDAALMPGLVNVHTHLDYTVMRGLLEDIAFFPWIRELNARKSALTRDDWVASATMGAAEAVAGGVTTLADCTDSGAACLGAKSLGLGGVIYQEVFGIDNSEPTPRIVAALQAKVERLHDMCSGTLLTVGISPHSPYTVRPDLFRALAAYAHADTLPVCIHAAESRAEAELLGAGTGPIAEMFARRAIDWVPPRTSTVSYLDSLGILGPGTLLVHGVQVSASDRHIVRARSSAWAHCPKSNAKLGNGIAPLGLIADFRRDAGDASQAVMGRLGLGSDSVASNNTMDLFEEMRFAVLMHRGARHRIEAFTAHEAITIATMGGARALGMDREIGSLEAGKRADLCVVRLNDLHSIPAYSPYSALVYAARASDVIYTMIGGVPRYDASLSPRLIERFPHIDLAPARAILLAASKKMIQWSPDA